jgi:hypothetical protein
MFGVSVSEWCSVQARAVAGVIAEKDRATTATFRRLIDEGQGRSMQEALDYEIDTVLTKCAALARAPHLATTLQIVAGDPRSFLKRVGMKRREGLVKCVFYLNVLDTRMNTNVAGVVWVIRRDFLQAAVTTCRGVCFFLKLFFIYSPCW